MSPSALKRADGICRSQHFLDYYRCPNDYADFGIGGPLSEEPKFFNWGKDLHCYARTADNVTPNQHDGNVHGYQNGFDVQALVNTLPFNPEELLENLLQERYASQFHKPKGLSQAIVKKLYYVLRPYLSVPVRKYLQKAHLRNWDKIPFPHWPVDFTVDQIQSGLLAASMRVQGVEKVPFIWFWPDGYQNCMIITHDVEELAGRNFCGRLMDIDESFGFRSSFQVVPEVRYPVPRDYLESIISRGFEVNVHDLKHDGHLYTDHSEFLRRAKQINQYGRDFGAVGFRAGVLYRNPDWYDEFDFLYDMSIPNVAHLDPQRGGCCTVKPYFIGDMVELPVTCTQDYTLFNILQDYSIDLWKEQVRLIQAQDGMISFIVHPDYIIEQRAQDVYRSLLGYLAELREMGRVWAPLPREVAQWWRVRQQLQLVCEDGQWRIEGEGKERASIAYACLDGDDLTYIHSAN